VLYLLDNNKIVGKCRPLTINPHHKPYDSTLKGLFEAEVAGIIPYLLPQARLKGTPLEAERNVELNRTTLITDKVYWTIYKGITILLNIELQVKADSGLCRRLLAYNGSLHNEFKVPVLSLVIFLFEDGPRDLFYEEKCADEVFATLHPKVICLRDLDSEKIVREHQLSFYALLPATKRPEVHLLKQALKEMYEYYDDKQFAYRVTWFECIMSRTKTMSSEEKQTIQEELRMEYQYDALIMENPTIMELVAKSLAEGKAEGKAEGIQEAILDVVSDRFSAQIVAQVQQTIAPAQDVQELRKFLRQVARASDEQEVQALLTQCFPLEGEIKGIQEAIFDVVSVRFSSQTVAQVQQTIAPVQDVQELRKFLRQLARASDEQEVSALLTQWFPIR